MRAQLTSAQLSTYFVGYLEHADLRAEAERRGGEHFDLKAFHRAALDLGSLGLDPLRAALARL